MFICWLISRLTPQMIIKAPQRHFCPSVYITFISFMTSIISMHRVGFCLIWFFTSQSTIFQLCWEGLPGLSQYLARINVSCSIFKLDAGEAHTRNPCLESSTLPLSHCTPYAELVKVWILISWLLGSQLICIYTVFQIYPDLVWLGLNILSDQVLY